MIPEIRNPILRRAAVVFTVTSIVVCLGPVYLVRAVLRWVESEFDVDLKAAWRGPPPIDPLANCTCRKVSPNARCYERCGE